MPIYELGADYLRHLHDDYSLSAGDRAMTDMRPVVIDMRLVGAECGCMRCKSERYDALVKDLAEAVRLLDALLGLEMGSSEAALAFVEGHRADVGQVPSP